MTFKRLSYLITVLIIYPHIHMSTEAFSYSHADFTIANCFTTVNHHHYNNWRTAISSDSNVYETYCAIDNNMLNNVGKQKKPTVTLYNSTY